MFGVMRETLESDGGSMSGEDDFFSVARTTPLVAGWHQFPGLRKWVSRHTLYPQAGDALVHGV